MTKSEKQKVSELLEELLKTKDAEKQAEIKSKLNEYGLDNATIDNSIHEIRFKIKEYIKSLEVNKSGT